MTKTTAGEIYLMAYFLISLEFLALIIRICFEFRIYSNYENAIDGRFFSNLTGLTGGLVMI